jgi:hypothetical protein
MTWAIAWRTALSFTVGASVLNARYRISRPGDSTSSISSSVALPSSWICCGDMVRVAMSMSPFFSASPMASALS